MTKGKIPEGLLVRHKPCNNHLCCNPEHLILGTHADNMRDLVEARTQAGEGNPNSKLSYDKVKVIRDLRRKGATLKQLSLAFGVHFSTIDLIVRGKTWKEDP